MESLYDTIGWAIRYLYTAQEKSKEIEKIPGCLWDLGVAQENVASAIQKVAETLKEGKIEAE